MPPKKRGASVEAASDAKRTRTDPEANETPKRSVGRPRKAVTEAHTEAPAPKRRGRPPKSDKPTAPTSAAEPVARRESGRIAKLAETTEDKSEGNTANKPAKRGPGRPPTKQASKEDAPTPKPGRGRPKKNATPVAKVVREDERKSEKKTVGRPKKVTTEDILKTDAPAKRGPGRPPKSSYTKADASEKDDKSATDAPKRGRPPKATTTSPATSKAAVAKPVAGKRGRPTKTATAAAVTTTPKKEKEAAPAKSTTGRGPGRPPKAESKTTAAPKTTATPKEKVEKKTETATEDENAPHYWLLKAEPESRIENGKDVKFSIDDLKDVKEPEAWDGVRNPVARNNMQAMKKGELAFFYHSNCKVPGIAGIMKIAEEAAPDESAFDSNHPYYDAKSDHAKPKWFCVRVSFVKKFDNLIALTDLKANANSGGVLKDMQLVKQSRLSVSKVSAEEWKFINQMAGIDEEGDDVEEKDDVDKKMAEEAPEEDATEEAEKEILETAPEEESTEAVTAAKEPEKETAEETTTESNVVPNEKDIAIDNFNGEKESEETAAEKVNGDTAAPTAENPQNGLLSKIIPEQLKKFAS